MNEWVSIISTLGFPIAACCFLAWYVSTTLKEFRVTIDTNSDLIKELILLIRERGVIIERREDNARD